MIHDLHFKELMCHRDLFIDACKAYLPKGLQRRVKWDSVKLVNIDGTGVSQSSSTSKLKQSYADVIYQFTYDGNSAGYFLVHFEAQTTPDALMPLRFAVYNCNTLLKIAKNHKLKGNLPVVVSLLYYQGKITPYPHSMNLLDLFADKALASKHLFKPKLVDVGQLSDEEIAQHGQFSPAEYLFKHAIKRNLGKRAISGFCEQVKLSYNIDNSLPRVVLTMLRYALEISDIDDEAMMGEVLKAFPEHTGDIMTAAEQLRQKGRAQGREEGAQENAHQVAIRSIKEGVDLQIIQKITQLPLAKIKALAKELATK